MTFKLYDVIKKEKDGRDIVREEHPIQTRILTEETPKKFSPRKVAIVVVALVVLACIYVVGVWVTRAKVTITEQKIPFSFSNESFEFVYDKDATSGRLSFQTMAITDEVTREAYGAEAVPSTTSAKGSVVLFNEYSTKPISIKAGTILTATNAKKYKTLETVSVPGYTTTSKTKNPGTSTPVAIAAVDTGASYNSNGTGLTVPGYTSKQLYGQTVGAITGGDAGIAHVVSDADKPQVVATLQAQLLERLKRQTRAQIPDDLITFPELQFLTIDPAGTVLKGSNIRFPAKMRGTLVTYLIPREQFEAAIAQRAILQKTYARVHVPNLSDITITPVTAIPSKATPIPTTITLSVTGSGTIVADASVESLRDSLVGIKKGAFGEHIATIQEIDEAKMSLFPFWSPYFPRNKDRITIIIK